MGYKLYAPFTDVTSMMNISLSSKTEIQKDKKLNTFKKTLFCPQNIHTSILCTNIYLLQKLCFIALPSACKNH